MHTEAFTWIAKHGTSEPVTVLDLGGRDLNGSAKYAWPNAATYRVLDILPGEGVDIVADASTWEPDEQYDVVVCAETFEHTSSWPGICRTAYAALKPGGRFIVTTAGPGRPQHSGIDGGWQLHKGEHYANVPGPELERVLRETGFRDIIVDCRPSPADTRSVATR